MHRQEGDVEADESQPEGNDSQAVVQLLAIEEREEVIQTGQHREDHSADHDVVQMGHDEIAVVRLEVKWHQGHHDSRQATQDKHHQTAEGK